MLISEESEYRWTFTIRYREMLIWLKNVIEIKDK